MKTIPNAQLNEEIIPRESADISTILSFALTFNGYEHWGSFEKCAEIANAWLTRYTTKRETPPALTECRTCLFFEARRWRHYGYDPDENTVIYFRALIDKIRALVVSRNFL